MPQRTSLRDAERVETAEDLDDVVTDKRQGWRATASRARRRQRRYKRRLTKELAQLAQGSDEGAAVDDSI